MNLADTIKTQIVASGGWWPFDQFMHAALYTPGLGYYSQDPGTRPRFGLLPQSGSDFATAPLISPLFGRCLAQQMAQFFLQQPVQAGVAAASQPFHVWEFGAGTGLLAAHILPALTPLLPAPVHYHIIEVSAALQAQQADTLAAWLPQVTWHSQLPEQLAGFIFGNEVLDAMPVKLLARINGRWHERGVALTDDAQGLGFSDRPSELRPPCPIEGQHDYLTEIQAQALAFMRTVALAMRQAQRAGQPSMALFIDYGFPEAEYYHPQRDHGTLMCHTQHRSDDQPLRDVGDKDITSHIDFTALALAAQDMDLALCGYTSQAHFLWNCGLATQLDQADLPTRIQAHRLIAEHEMGELFKVIAFSPDYLDLCGFSQGDRSQRLG